MAEQFFTLMADLDNNSQEIMSGWYKNLRDAGFTGTQTPELPFHISLAIFSPDKEKEAAEEVFRLAEEFAPVSVHISHIGLFSGGRVLFGAPDMNPSGLLKLRDAIKTQKSENYPWTPHATILIDEPDIIHDALQILIQSFRPFVGKITGLHLCAFWPTREIASAELTGDK